MAESEQFFGSRLRVARTFNGYTLAEVGEAICTTRQYIQKLEVDDSCSPPANTTVEALASLLHVEPVFFNSPLLDEVQEEECHFRKAKTTPVNIRTRARSCGTFFGQILKYVDSHVDLPSLKIPLENVPPPQSLTREHIEKIAEKTRLAWNLHPDEPIHNVTRTLENAGCVVTTFHGVSEKVDAFSFIRSRAVIVSNTAKGNTARSRFDRAHEGGHVVLHRGIESGDPLLDEQANQFASAFLLPRSAFIREFPKNNKLYWPKIIEMSKRWGVSLQALIRRAYDLSIIDPVKYRYAHVYINKYIKEDVLVSIAPQEEVPEILPQVISLLRDSKGLMVSDIAESLHVKPEVLNSFGIYDSPGSNPSKNVIYLEKHRKTPELSRAGKI